MTRQFQDWRKELEVIDAELIGLYERRVQLAIEMLQTLSSELSLGSLTYDAERLSLLMFECVEEFSLVLDKKAVRQFFKILSNECRRLAEQEVRARRVNGKGVKGLVSQSELHSEEQRS